MTNGLVARNTLPKRRAKCSHVLRMSSDKPFVLVIEDDSASAEALSMILRDWGAEVAHAAHAGALDAALGARAQSLSFIITDFHLGDGPDGVSLATEIAAKVPQARILVLSGSFHGKAAVAAEQAGFDMMPKPARADAIVAWLER